MNDVSTPWENLTPEEKKKQLFLKQKNTLDLFLERNAISKAQYEKSLGDLIEKMGMQVFANEIF
jgi:dissimilatory sulfite reductase (desulfoviridin) alpha/beta subunit